MAIQLNDNELAVYNACVKGIYGDTGCEFDIPYGCNNLSKSQIKGYLSDLEKKGLIQMDDTGDYYCDGWLVANLDGTPFMSLDEWWTGKSAYKFNAKAGLYQEAARDTMASENKTLKEKRREWSRAYRERKRLEKQARGAKINAAPKKIDKRDAAERQARKARLEAHIKELDKAAAIAWNKAVKAAEKASTKSVKMIAKKCAGCDRPFVTEKVTGKYACMEMKLCPSCYGSCC